jgi:hypothetical protein
MSSEESTRPGDGQVTITYDPDDDHCADPDIAGSTLGGSRNRGSRPS